MYLVVAMVFSVSLVVAGHAFAVAKLDSACSENDKPAREGKGCGQKNINGGLVNLVCHSGVCSEGDTYKKDAKDTKEDAKKIEDDGAKKSEAAAKKAAADSSGSGDGGSDSSKSGGNASGSGDSSAGDSAPSAPAAGAPSVPIGSGVLDDPSQLDGGSSNLPQPQMTNDLGASTGIKQLEGNAFPSPSGMGPVNATNGTTPSPFIGGPQSPAQMLSVSPSESTRGFTPNAGGAQAPVQVIPVSQVTNPQQTTGFTSPTQNILPDNTPVGGTGQSFTPGPVDKPYTTAAVRINDVNQTGATPWANSSSGILGGGRSLASGILDTPPQAGSIESQSFTPGSASQGKSYEVARVRANTSDTITPWAVQALPTIASQILSSLPSMSELSSFSGSTASNVNVVPVTQNYGSFSPALAQASYGVNGSGLYQGAGYAGQNSAVVSPVASNALAGQSSGAPQLGTGSPGTDANKQQAIAGYVRPAASPFNLQCGLVCPPGQQGGTQLASLQYGVSPTGQALTTMTDASPAGGQSFVPTGNAEEIALSAYGPGMGCNVDGCDMRMEGKWETSKDNLFGNRTPMTLSCFAEGSCPAVTLATSDTSKYGSFVELGDVTFKDAEGNTRVAHDVVGYYHDYCPACEANGRTDIAVDDFRDVSRTEGRKLLDSQPFSDVNNGTVLATPVEPAGATSQLAARAIDSLGAGGSIPREVIGTQSLMDMATARGPETPSSIGATTIHSVNDTLVPAPESFADRVTASPTAVPSDTAAGVHGSQVAVDMNAPLEMAAEVRPARGVISALTERLMDTSVVRGLGSIGEMVTGSQPTSSAIPVDDGVATVLATSEAPAFIPSVAQLEMQHASPFLGHEIPSASPFIDTVASTDAPSEFAVASDVRDYGTHVAEAPGATIRAQDVTPHEVVHATTPDAADVVAQNVTPDTVRGTDVPDTAIALAEGKTPQEVGFRSFSEVVSEKVSSVWDAAKAKVASWFGGSDTAIAAAPQASGTTDDLPAAPTTGAPSDSALQLAAKFAGPPEVTPVSSEPAPVVAIGDSPTIMAGARGTAGSPYPDSLDGVASPGVQTARADAGQQGTNGAGPVVRGGGDVAGSPGAAPAAGGNPSPADAGTIPRVAGGAPAVDAPTRASSPNPSPTGGSTGGGTMQGGGQQGGSAQTSGQNGKGGGMNDIAGLVKNLSGLLQSMGGKGSGSSASSASTPQVTTPVTAPAQTVLAAPAATTQFVPQAPLTAAPKILVVANPNPVDASSAATISWTTEWKDASNTTAGECAVADVSGALLTQGASTTSSIQTPALDRATYFFIGCKQSGGKLGSTQILIRVKGDTRSPLPPPSGLAAYDSSSGGTAAASDLSAALAGANAPATRPQAQPQNQPSQPVDIACDPNSSQYFSCLTGKMQYVDKLY